MPRVCMFSGKKTKAGRTRSHSMRQWKRLYKANIIKKKIHLGDGVYTSVKISAKMYKKYRGLVEWV